MTALSTEMAVLLVGVAARQAASPTAAAAARLALAEPMVDLLAPEHGAFHQAVALALTRRQYE